MQFEKLFDIIDKSKLGKIIIRKQNIIENTDPDRIYVENIRSFFNFPFPIAKLLCEMAVKEKLFIKKIGLLCPNADCGRIIKSYEINERIDKFLTCEQCQLKEEEKNCFLSSELDRIIYYQLRQNHDN